MARIHLHPGVSALSGRLGDWVFRTRNDRTYASRLPERRRDDPTEAQLAQRLRFREAAAYARAALANPPARAFYADCGARKQLSAYAAAMRDALNAPVIHDIALTLYQGYPGDEIIVHASDDSEVAGVTVAIRDMTGRIIETGAARPYDGVWIYDATTRAPYGQPLTIVVTALDRPGNEVTRTKPWVPTS